MMLGAKGVQLGTAFLSCPEASVHPLWKKALSDSSSRGTRITSSFTGRPARGIVNRLIEDMENKNDIIPDFPTVGSIIKPLANIAADHGNDDFLSLWAGQSAPMNRNVTSQKLIELLVEETSTTLNNFYKT